MKDLLGYFLIAQAIITGVIVHTIYAFSDSIIDAVVYAVSPGDSNLAWGSGPPIFIWGLLIVVIGLGVFVIAKKK